MESWARYGLLNEFQIVLHFDGHVEWRFNYANYAGFGYDLFTGLYYGQDRQELVELFRGFIPQYEEWILPGIPTSLDEDENGIPDECEGGPTCTTLESIDPPDCAIDARQPSWPDGTNAEGWKVVELTFNAECEASTLTSGDYLVEVLPDGTAPTFNVATSGNTATLTLDPFVGIDAANGLGKWTCFSHADTSGKKCLGYLPGDVNSDRSSNAAIDITALITCINNFGTCDAWQADIDRSGGDPGVLDITRLIDLFNGSDQLANWNGATLGDCPSE